MTPTLAGHAIAGYQLLHGPAQDDSNATPRRPPHITPSFQRRKDISLRLSNPQPKIGSIKQHACEVSTKHDDLGKDSQAEQTSRHVGPDLIKNYPMLIYQPECSSEGTAIERQLSEPY